MKRALLILTIAILLPAAAFAGQPQDSKQKPPQDTTDWLNAPTPDGSPTLKVTSDWLAKTLADYGGGAGLTDDDAATVIHDIHIDSDCSFHYSERLVAYPDSGIIVSLPLGAVTSISDHAAIEVANYVTVKTGGVNAIRHSSILDRNHKEVVSYIQQDGFRIENRPAVVPGGAIAQDPAQIIPRIMSALQHAADLCRSTYKAPAQAKEPF